MKKNTGLGRGFDTLLPQGLDVSLLNGSKVNVVEIDISAITANPNQPRRVFDDALLNDMADSIRKHGVIQPIIVTLSKEHQYQIIAGERRWRASKLAGLKTIPAIVRSVEELENLEVAIIENIQRVDLTALEQADSIQKLHDLFSLSFEDIAKRLGKAVSTIHNSVRLLRLSQDAKEALADNRITEGHARSLLSLEGNPDKQAELLRLTISNHWTVRQAEQFVVAVKNGENNVVKAAQQTMSHTSDTKALEKVLNRKVSIKNMAKGGRLYIQYRDEEDLKKLINGLLGK